MAANAIKEVNLDAGFTKSEIVIDSDSKFDFVTSGEISSLKDAKLKLNSEYLLRCWIMVISCECGTTYTTQYCDEGLHGTPSQWVNRVCDQSCGPIGGIE